MTTKEVTGRIRITKIPEGEAPLWVREVWVGLVLPCEPICGFSHDVPDRGVVSGTPRLRNRYGFAVPRDVALLIVESKSPQAAAWWQANGSPASGEYFGFDESEAEILSGVVFQRIHPAPED